MLTLVVLAILAAFFYHSHLDEPKYQGRTLTEWMKTTDATIQGEANYQGAIRAMGTNAIPVLLQKLSKTNSSLLSAEINLYRRFGFLRHPWTAEMDNLYAAQAFQFLGRTASNALPALLDIFHRNASMSSVSAAVGCIINVGSPQEVSTFMSELVTNSDTGLATSAFYYLAPTNSPEISVPRLVDAITNPASKFRNASVSWLSKFGTNARPAIPVLLAMAAAPGPTNWDAKQLLFHLDRDLASRVLTNEPYTFEAFKEDEVNFNVRSGLLQRPATNH